MLIIKIKTKVYLHHKTKSLYDLLVLQTNTCDVIPDTKQKHDPYKLISF